MDAVEILKLTALLAPKLVDILTHYKEIAARPDTAPEDKAKAAELLESLRWKSFDELEKEAG